MNNNLKLALVAAFAVSFSASAHQTVNALVDSQGNAVKNNFGDCVEVVDNDAHVQCGAQEPEMIEETFTLGAHALFDTNKSIIKAAGKAQLDELSAKIKNAASIGRVKSISGISVVGHTDSRASDAYNQALSERRANSVRNYLIQTGVKSEMINARGEGEMNPVATNSTADGRQQNRRVDITVSGVAIKSVAN